MISLKKILKNIVNEKILDKTRSLKKIKYDLEACRMNQISYLKNKYSTLINKKIKLNDINMKEFRVFSQNGEDGMIMYIFSKIGVKNYKFVEFGIEDGKQCNTANLSINFGWGGLVMDSNSENIKRAKDYYRRNNVLESQLKIIRCLVTKDNINFILKKNGMSGEIDLLSIDIDGNDYFIWQAIEEVKPRVVVIEYNAFFGTDKSISVKYDPQFDRYKKHKSGKYYGASLRALTKLSKSKGYSLVGCDSNGVNAFFVKKEIVKKSKLKELSVKEAYYKRSGFSDEDIKKIFDNIKNLPYEQV